MYAVLLLFVALKFPNGINTPLQLESNNNKSNSNTQEKRKIRNQRGHEKRQVIFWLTLLSCRLNTMMTMMRRRRRTTTVTIYIKMHERMSKYKKYTTNSKQNPINFNHKAAVWLRIIHRKTCFICTYVDF